MAGYDLSPVAETDSGVTASTACWRRSRTRGSDGVSHWDHEVFQGAAEAKVLARGMTPISIMRRPHHGQRSSDALLRQLAWQVDIVVTGTDRRERPAQTKSPYFRPKSLSEKYWQPLSLSHRTASRIVGRAHSSISGSLSVTWKPPSQIHEIEALIPLA